MLGLDLFEFEVKTPIEEKVTRFVNDVVLEIFYELREWQESDEKVFDFCFSEIYLREHKDARNRFFELIEIMESNICRKSIEPIYENILYQCLWFANDGYFNETIELSESLKDEIASELGDRAEYIIESILDVDCYLDFMFWDYDFLYAEMIVDMHNQRKSDSADKLIGLKSEDYLDFVPVDTKKEFTRQQELEKECDNKIESIVSAIVNAIKDFEKRVLDFENRSEKTITFDLYTSIKQVLNKDGIVVANEAPIGRALKQIGETDLYFYGYKDNILKDLAVLESKNIEKFEDQYKQLLGYLNKNFEIGITLSINRKMSFDKAKEKMLGLLHGSLTKEKLVNEVKQQNDKSRSPLVAVSSHFIPEELDSKMPVYHFIFNLYDKERNEFAHQARKK